MAEELASRADAPERGDNIVVRNRVLDDMWKDPRRGAERREFDSKAAEQALEGRSMREELSLNTRLA